jgi:hypothetical protein
MRCAALLWDPVGEDEVAELRGRRGERKKADRMRSIASGSKRADLANPAQVSSLRQVTSHGVSREEQEEAVLTAARAERRERKALEALGARQPGWTEAEEQAHRAQLERWLAASRTLVNALDGVKGESRARLYVHRL